MSYKLPYRPNPPTTGLTLYGIFRNATQQGWNGSAYVNWTTTRDTFDVPMSESPASTGQYSLTVPASLTVGRTEIEMYKQLGGTPSDQNDIRVAWWPAAYWDGTEMSEGANVIDIAGQRQSAFDLYSELVFRSPRRVWCVDPFGDDSNSGSIESPFLTLEAASDSVSNGDTIELAPGNHARTTTWDLSAKHITVLWQPGAAITFTYSGVDYATPAIKPGKNSRFLFPAIICPSKGSGFNAYSGNVDNLEIAYGNLDCYSDLWLCGSSNNVRIHHNYGVSRWDGGKVGSLYNFQFYKNTIYVFGEATELAVDSSQPFCGMQLLGCSGEVYDNAISMYKGSADARHLAPFYIGSESDKLTPTFWRNKVSVLQEGGGNTGKAYWFVQNEEDDSSARINVNTRDDTVYLKAVNAADAVAFKLKTGAPSKATVVNLRSNVDTANDVAAAGAIEYVNKNISDTLADTNELQLDWVNGGRLDNILDARSSQTSVDTANTAITNIQNNTFIASTIPQQLERPDSGSASISITFTFADETGTAKNLDASANPAMTLVNDAGTDRSSRLGSFSNPATGKYVIAYTNTSSDTIEGLHWDVTGTINSKLRRYVAYTQIVDITAVDFTSTDRTNLGLTLAAAAAARTASESADTKLDDVSDDIAAVKLDTASTKGKSDQMVFTDPNKIDSTSTISDEQIAEIAAAVGAGVSPSDFATQPIAQQSTFTLVDTSQGWRTEQARRITRSDTPAPFAVDFRNAMTLNQKAFSMTTVEFMEGDSGDVTISDAADFLRDGGTKYHFMMTPATVGVYRVRLTPLWTNPSGGTPGDILFEVFA